MTIAKNVTYLSTPTGRILLTSRKIDVNNVPEGKTVLSQVAAFYSTALDQLYIGEDPSIIHNGYLEDVEPMAMRVATVLHSLSESNKTRGIEDIVFQLNVYVRVEQQLLA